MIPPTRDSVRFDRPYCFVIMPFGVKPDPKNGRQIDFDRIYERCLRPAIERAGLIPHRDDALVHGGQVSRGIYEALMLSEFAIADLTLANGNVLYELGVRHAVRPSSTLTITARPDSVPFDLKLLRTIRYQLNDRSALTPVNAKDLQNKVQSALRDLQARVTENNYVDSPLYQVIEDWRPPTPSSLKTDVYRDRVSYDERVRNELQRCRHAALRSRRLEALRLLRKARSKLGSAASLDSTVAIDLMLTYRALELWGLMVTFAGEIARPVRDQPMIQEQLALALNRSASRQRQVDDAADLRYRGLSILRRLKDQGLATSETWGLIGRVEKDAWREASDADTARRHLEEAIKAYGSGFEIDPTDTYPGTNLVTLTSIRNAPNAREDLDRLLPVVEFAAHRLIRLQTPTYWMHAALMECAILRDSRDQASSSLTAALELIEERWQPTSTYENLQDIVRARQGRGLESDWIIRIAARLQDGAKRIRS